MADLLIVARAFFLSFLLPLLGFGLVMAGAEWGLQYLGFSGNHAWMLRGLVFLVFGAVALRSASTKASAEE